VKKKILKVISGLASVKSCKLISIKCRKRGYLVMTVQEFLKLRYDSSYPIFIKNLRNNQIICDVEHIHDLNFWNGYTDTVKEAEVHSWIVENNRLGIHILR